MLRDLSEITAIVCPANRLLPEVDSISALKSFLRSHLPERGPTSICRHGEVSSTESSHVIRFRRNGTRWLHLVGRPCENDYQERACFHFDRTKGARA